MITAKTTAKSNPNNASCKVTSECIHKLKKYRLKETFLDDPIYRIDQDIEAYDEMICFCEKNQKSISFVSMWYEIEITEEERRRAVAFVPCFPDYYCEEYPDGENDYNECEFCYSKRRRDNPFFVLPKGYIKSHENECGMAGMEGFHLYHIV